MNVEFGIEASGDNLHFQWQKDGSDLSDGGKYWGVNTDTLCIVAVEGAVATNFSYIICVSQLRLQTTQDQLKLTDLRAHFNGSIGLL